MYNKSNFITPFLNLFLKLDVAQVGLIIAIFTISSALGSLICGALTDKWGRKKALYIFFGLSIFLTLAIILTNTWLIFTIVYALIGFLQGGYLAGVTALYMDTTDPEIVFDKRGYCNHCNSYFAVSKRALKPWSKLESDMLSLKSSEKYALISSHT